MEAAHSTAESIPHAFTYHLTPSILE